MDHPILRPTWETTLPTAWQDQLVPAVQIPWLPQTAMPHGNALLPRFVAWYEQLQALPRRLRRALQRKLALPLAGVALLLALGQGLSQATTLVVDGATCTPVDAITAANTDTAQRGCPAGSGADTLVLEPPASMVTLTHVDNTTYGPTGLPVIKSAITITGQGGTIARAPSAPAFRLLAVSGTGNLTLQDITLTGGAASGSFPAGWGGGLLNYNGEVSIENSTISGNTGNGVVTLANDGGHTTLTLTKSTVSGNSGEGVSNAVASSGSSRGGSATLTIAESTIIGNGNGVGNTAASYLHDGPGDATVTITRSTISGNSGGGISNPPLYYGGGGSTVTIARSTISGNRGPGVSNFGDGPATITLTESTISGNTSAYNGGGVYNFGYFGNAVVTLIQSTITGNTAGGNGGGIFNLSYYSDATVTLIQSTITGNTAGGNGGGIFNRGYYRDATVTLAGSLVTGNRAPTAPEIGTNGADNAVVQANAFNLFGFNGDSGVSGLTPGPTDLVPSMPLTAILDPVLADHGGPTLTHALIPGSPAIDAIPSGTHGCGTTNYGDQRGTARPQPAGGPCDIGAYEVEVTGQSLGAWVVGLAPRTVVCKNVTTAQEVTISDQAAAWDCEAAGLGVSAGDQVAMRVRGTVAGGATDVGGALTGMTPNSGGCTNLTTGQQVSFQHMVGATAASCVAAGLGVHPGDTVQMSVQGIAK